MINSKIKIEPRVIQHLGQDLITSPEVAVTELLKNSIDAGSEKINIHIFDTFDVCMNSAQFMRPLSGDFSSHVSSEIVDVPLCIIEDVGCGMSPIGLEKGFLSVGTKNKVNQADTLGEKGIGRLSTQRLGKTVIVETVSEKTLSVLRLDWDKIISGNDDVTIIDSATESDNYTRIWIFGIDITDFLDVDNQLSLNNDEEIDVNSELKTAITFLISPFNHFQTLHPKKINISMYYGAKALNVYLDMGLLECSESTHYFRISSDEENSELVMDYGLEIQPWYVERLHKVLTPTPQLFAQTRQKHGYYADFIQKYRERIDATLHHRLDEAELAKTIVQFLERQYQKKELTSDRKIALEQRAIMYIRRIKAILPIESQIFTFKQNVEVGQKIILDSIRESIGHEYELTDLKHFLSNSNGIKLYRDVFRIGFLGNKENDWIKMQQYRTKGQQFYRFDLGNTLGYVSINDPKQAIVKEISSRLDLIETNETTAFKMVINIIFNQIFYDLNRTANALIKNLLQEDGLLRVDPPKELKKKTDGLRELQRKTDEIRKITASVEVMLKECTPSEDGTHVVIPSKTYDSTRLALSKMVSFLDQSATAQCDAIQAMEDAEQHVLQVNADLYNNYKLMANGMITEAITHELDSVSKTSIPQDADLHFKTLKKFVLDNDGVLVYNNNFVPIRDSYRLVSKKLSHVADFNVKSTHNRRERPVHGHRGGSRGRFYYRITTFEGRPWDARDPYKTTFMALKHEIRLSIWRKQKETPGVEKAPGVSSPQRKESGRSGRDDGELWFWVRPGHPYKAVTSISQAEALAHGLTHLHHLVFAAVLARELDWCAALQDAREDARPWGVVGIGLRSDVWVEVRRDDHRPAVLVT